MKILVLKLSLSLLLLSLCHMGSAQNLRDHLWQERVLLVIGIEDGNIDFEQQLQEFEGQKQALKERKIVIYQIKEDNYKMGLKATAVWKPINDPELSQIISQSNHKFEVVLIGLDGGIKKRQRTMMSTVELEQLIDSMPMRQQELRNGNQKGNKS